MSDSPRSGIELPGQLKIQIQIQCHVVTNFIFSDAKQDAIDKKITEEAPEIRSDKRKPG